MIETQTKVKMTPKQARYVIMLLKEALKMKRRKKQQNLNSIALVITDIDIQVETDSEFLYDHEPERDGTDRPYKRTRI